MPSGVVSPASIPNIRLNSSGSFSEPRTRQTVPMHTEMGCFSFGDHDKERIASNHAIHFLYGHVLFAGDDTLHLFRLVPMLVANLSVFFMIACNLQVGRIFMGIRISVLQRSENVRVDKGRVENMKKKKPGPFGGERTGLYNQFVNHL